MGENKERKTVGHYEKSGTNSLGRRQTTLEKDMTKKKEEEGFVSASEFDTTIEWVASGFPALDVLLGGGIPLGKMVEFAGSWSTGKTTLAQQIVATVQKKHNCLWVDAEFSWNNDYATSMGVDLKKIDLFRGQVAEENLDAIEKWATSHKKGLIVLDAVGALLPREEAEKDSSSRSIGLQARLIGSFCRRIIPILDKQKNCLIILNHTFTALDTGALQSSGGKKLEYARSIFLTMRRAYGKPVKRTTDGRKTLIPMEIEVRKNKLAALEGMKAVISFVPGQGFSHETTEGTA